MKTVLPRGDRTMGLPACSVLGGLGSHDPELSLKDASAQTYHCRGDAHAPGTTGTAPTGEAGGFPERWKPGDLGNKPLSQQQERISPFPNLLSPSQGLELKATSHLPRWLGANLRLLRICSAFPAGTG